LGKNQLDQSVSALHYIFISFLTLRMPNALKLSLFRKSVVLGYFLFCCFPGISQQGDYYLTHHTPPAELIDNINFDILQDVNGLMWVANRKGVAQYDGVNWRLLPAPAAIFSLALDSASNTLYAGGRNLIGKVAFNDLNQQIFTPIRQDPLLDDIITVHNNGLEVLFLSENNLYALDKVSDSVVVIPREIDQVFTGIFEYQGQILITTEGPEILKYQAGKFTNFVLQADDTLSKIMEIVWIEAFDKTTSLIIDAGGGVYLSKDGILEMIVLKEEDQDYLTSSLPLEAKWVTDSLVAISTLSGGVVFFDPTENEIEEIVNYHTGLPDNQIYTIAVDFDQGIWVAHDYGFTRIAPLMPFRSYGNFPGLEGNILSVARFNDQIYVGTNLGVFYLEEVKDFKETEFYIRTSSSKANEKKDEDSRDSASKKTSKTSKEDDTEKADDPKKAKKKKKKKGVFNFLRKKNKNVDEPSDPDQTAEEQTSGIEQEQDVPLDEKEKKGFFNRLFGGRKDLIVLQDDWEKRYRRELLSIRYMFKKIESIPAKTDLLIPHEAFLLSSGLSGIYEIKENQTTLISDEPIRYTFFSEKNNILFASTYQNTILTFDYLNGTWRERDLLEGLEDIVFQITEKENSIWLCSADSLYRIEIENQELIDVDVFEINNPYFEETYAVSSANRLYFVNSSGYYYYDSDQRTILEDEVLKNNWGVPERFFCWKCRKHMDLQW